jgi:hypothetical protein
MFETLIKNFLPRALQDVITTAVSLLAAHGYITQNDVQSTIGSLFFLGMLVVNYFIAQNRKSTAAVAGAAATGSYLAPADASAIAKGKTP